MAAEDYGQLRRWCEGQDGATPDRQITACTAVIQSGRESSAGLAISYYNVAREEFIDA
jgi:hypothetical protein